MHTFAQQVLESANMPGGVLRMEEVAADASARRYTRLWLADAGPMASMIVMEFDPREQPLHPPGRVVGAPPIEEPSTSEPAFVNIQRYLCGKGIAVPTVYGYDPAGFIALQDFGDTTLCEYLHAQPQRAPLVYHSAVRVLAQLHHATRDADGSCVAFHRQLDTSLLRWELDHFEQWGLEHMRGPVAAADKATLHASFDRLTDELAHAPAGFSHRDFQSRNLMVLGEEADGVRLGILDFQDAFLAPTAYDLVSLLWDSYVDLDDETRASSLELYAQLAPNRAVRVSEFLKQFWAATLQRKLKDAGRYVYLAKVRKKPQFAEYYVPALKAVAVALRERGQYGDEYEALGLLLSRHLPIVADTMARSNIAHHKASDPACGPGG
jgi:aminoglycoside/choline kinase family phosphotransferase